MTGGTSGYEIITCARRPRVLRLLGQREDARKDSLSVSPPLGPFLETPDIFPGPVSIFSSSFICQVMVIIGANLVACEQAPQWGKITPKNRRAKLANFVANFPPPRSLFTGYFQCKNVFISIPQYVISEG